MGAITAYAGLMAKRAGYKALYLSGGGVAANSLGMPDLGISGMEDVLTDARRIVDARTCRCWSTSIPVRAARSTSARTMRSLINVGAPPCTSKIRSAQKRCGHRLAGNLRKDEMVDRVKAAVDAAPMRTS